MIDLQTLLVPASLAVGALFAALSSGRWQVPIAAWLAPAFLLFATRTGDAAPTMVGLFIALFCAALVSNRGIVPVSRLAYVAMMAVQSGLVLVPFGIDRVLYPGIGGVAATLVFPIVWTALEFVGARTSAFGSWGSSAYSQYGNLPLTQLAAVTGIWGISFLMAWAGSVGGWALDRGLAASDVQAGLLLCGGVIALVLVGGGARLAFSGRSSRQVRVATVGRPDELLSPAEIMAILGDEAPSLDERERQRTTLALVNDELLVAAEREARAGARLVVWPEADAIVFAEDEAAFLDRSRALAQLCRVHLLMGLVTVHPGGGRHLENRAVLVDPGGAIVVTYLKSRPVPGWEASVSVPGDGRLPVVATDLGRVAVAICFDLDAPELVRQAGRARADLLLAPASDWSAIGPLHHAMATFRAVENGVALVRAARFGVSAAVDAFGRVVGSADQVVGGEALAVELPIGSRATPYARVGDLFAWVSVVGAVGLAVLAVGRLAGVI